MLATDDERREVARRLRAIEPDDFGSYSEEHECVEKILGTWDDCDKFLWRVVADLIEPSGHECVPGECPINVRHDNDRIDRDALLALADDIHRLVDDQEIRFFHVVQVHESTLSTIERRIREAVGGMSGYVGLKTGDVHERIELSEYYCARCGYPVTDHDSYCRECGGAFRSEAVDGALVGLLRETTEFELKDGPYRQRGAGGEPMDENRFANLIIALAAVSVIGFVVIVLAIYATA